LKTKAVVEDKKKLITKKDLRKSWWLWWMSLETSHSFERMQGVSFCVSMIPIFKKLYTTKEDMADALKRHLQFFNTNGIWGAVVPGIVIAMEEKKAQGEDIPVEAIIGTKTGLMGAIAGVGDTIDWGMWLPIILSLFIPAAQAGSGIAGIAPWIIFALITIFEGYTLFNLGHKAGENSVNEILKGGKIKALITGASILGLFMMGGLAASYINVSTPLVINAGMKTLAVQGDILDKIIPGLLPLLTVTGVYVYLEKVKRNFTYAMFILIVVGVVLGSLGILA
jgi:PTS system mannose-specific IID component